ncbi:hypothetical protein DFO77_11487 [Marinilabilia salmonicolor]|uniref:Uncharacterized protein n=1 Tax=Marinilabilia salmonicolor TaxID=989 RepID=A0A368V187_9BACT|nr:hypothetical protein DFO77_11487 [Marinilabilia salmonicolor]
MNTKQLLDQVLAILSQVRDKPRVSGRHGLILSSSNLK